MYLRNLSDICPSLLYHCIVVYCLFHY